MVYAQSRIHPDIQTDHLNSARRPCLVIVKKKKKEKKNLPDSEICRLPDHGVKLKESEKRDNYLHLARELKKLRNMKVTALPIVISPLGAVTKVLVLGLKDFEIRERMETIQTTALLRSARILRRVLET